MPEPVSDLRPITRRRGVNAGFDGFDETDQAVGAVEPESGEIGSEVVLGWDCIEYEIKAVRYGFHLVFISRKNDVIGS